MGFKSFRLELDVRPDAPPPAFATAIPQMFEALLDVFAPLDVTYAIDDGDFVRVARLDPTRAFAHEPLWCDEELTRDALTRCKPGLGTDVVTELYDRFAGIAPQQLYISAEGALFHRAPGTDEPAWYGRWRSQTLYELCTVSFHWTPPNNPSRGVEVKCPLSGYPFTSVRPLVRGALADGDPEIAAANRALLFPALAKVRGALGFDREEVEWGHDAADYGPLFPADRKDIAKRWLPLLAASLIFMFACKKVEPPSPMIAIELTYPGASAEVLEQVAVLPVEQAVATFARGIESRITSERATVWIEVDDVDRAVENARRVMPEQQLPRDMEHPVIRRARKDDVPLLWLAIEGDRPLVELSDVVRQEVVPEIERLAGVGQIELHGLATRAMVVRPDLDRLDAAGVMLFDVLAALQSASSDVQGGSITSGHTIRVKDELRDVAELVVHQANGAPVRLRDIAVVEETVERDGTGAPMLAIHAQDGARSDEVIDRVKAVIAKAPVKITETASPLPPKRTPKLVVQLRGPDLAQLRAAGDAITKQLAAKGIRDVVRDPPLGVAEESVFPDLQRAAELGVSPADVVATLRAIGGTRVGAITVRLPSTQLRESLDRVRVRAPKLGFVPLSAIVSTKTGESEAILRRDRERTIELSIYDAGGRDIIKAYTPPQGMRVMLSP